MGFSDDAGKAGIGAMTVIVPINNRRSGKYNIYNLVHELQGHEGPHVT
jgi:hypothetical protein